jgi:hypothetical protein
MNQEGRLFRKQFTHIAVQFDPEEGRTVDPERAKKYLEKVYSKSELQLDFYWGKVEDFTRELRERWVARTSQEGKVHP